MLGIVVNEGVIDRYTKFNGGTNPFSTRMLYDVNDWDGKSKKMLQTYSNMNRTWNDKLYLDPLPIDQLTLNPNLVQNPGW